MSVLDVAIVVINWNAAAHLAGLLDSIADFHQSVVEVVVVDNASADDSRKVLRDHPWARAVHHDTNLGFGGAANSAIAATRTRFVLLMNADLRVSRDSLHMLYRTALQDSTAAITCGPLLGVDGTPQTRFQFRALPTPWSILSDALFLDEVRHRLAGSSRSSRATDPLPPGIQPAAAYWMLRRSAWDQVGGFDPRFWPAWFEDVDLFKRFSEAGWKAVYCHSAPATHVGGVSLCSLQGRVFTRIFYSNLLRYVKKHHKAWFPFLWLPVQTGSLIRQCIRPGIRKA